MKYGIVPNSCRVCLRKNKKLRLRSIYSPHEEGDKAPREMLRLIAGIAVEGAHTSAELLPKSICKDCELSLNLAWQFRTRALKSQRLIEHYCCVEGGGTKEQPSDVASMVDVKLESEDEDEDHFMELHESLEEVCLHEEQLVVDGKQLKIEALELAYTDVEDATTEYLEDDDDEEEAIQTDAPYLDLETCAEEDEDDENEDDDDALADFDEDIKNQQQQQAEITDYEIVEFPRDRAISSVAVQTKSEHRLKATAQDNLVIAELRKELETLEDMLEATSPIDTSLAQEQSATTTTTPTTAKNSAKSSLNVSAKHSATSLGKSRRGRKPKCALTVIASGGTQNQRPATSGELSSVSSVVTLQMVPAKRCAAKKVYEESGHICDICGNIYEKRGRMMEHRRRHDKELRFACELCDKRFHLREKLRKHMFSHSGGKPFKCSFCSCSFFYESVRKAHEAVHNGHKPYVCEECNKAFAYSHTLKKHKLIHADIKLYHCKYCDKDFRLLHHMKQHEETKIHQTTMRSWEEEAAAAAARSKSGMKAVSTATV